MSAQSAQAAHALLRDHRNQSKRHMVFVADWGVIRKSCGQGRCPLVAVVTATSVPCILSARALMNWASGFLLETALHGLVGAASLVVPDAGMSLWLRQAGQPGQESRISGTPKALQGIKTAGDATTVRAAGNVTVGQLVASGAATLIAATNLTLAGNMSVGGNLIGSVGYYLVRYPAATLVFSGWTKLTSGAGEASLSGNNSLGGTVNVNATGNATLKTSGNTTLGSVTSGGKRDITARGQILIGALQSQAAAGEADVSRSPATALVVRMQDDANKTDLIAVSGARIALPGEAGKQPAQATSGSADQ